MYIIPVPSYSRNDLIDKLCEQNVFENKIQGINYIKPGGEV